MDSVLARNEFAPDLSDDEKVIPWAEGNGLWRKVSQWASDLVGVDIITFFVQNPYACDTAKGLAVRIGRQPYQVEPVLDRLVEASLLTRTDLGDMQVYVLTEDAQGRQTLQQYVAWLQEGYHWVRMAMEDQGIP